MQEIRRLGKDWSNSRSSKVKLIMLNRSTLKRHWLFCCLRCCNYRACRSGHKLPDKSKEYRDVIKALCRACRHADGRGHARGRNLTLVTQLAEGELTGGQPGVCSHCASESLTRG